MAPSTEAQVAASEALLDALGYDRDRGHTEIVANAVTVGNQYDCRIGLWPIEDQLKICILGTIHEFGHALYTHNLSQDHYGTPLGADRGIYVQESQAAFWDSQIARTKSFWEFAQPILSNYLPSLGASARELFESYVHVQPEQPNPLLTDEMSLQLHTLVRFEIEKKLINGELDVTEIPRVWRDLYEEYLSFRPESDAEGPLLTIHWAAGNFGYFPTYTLGHVLAAQVGKAARDSMDDFDAHVRDGEFEPIKRWLREEIHCHGQRYPTPELIQRVTGSELTAEPFLEYVTEKYSNLYDL